MNYHSCVVDKDLEGRVYAVQLANWGITCIFVLKGACFVEKCIYSWRESCSGT